MAKIRLSVLLVLLFSLVNQKAACSQDVNSDLQWLAGKWKRISNSSNQQFEIWHKSEAGLVGKGFTLKNEDTTFVEKLKIVYNSSGIYYIADVPHNNKPVEFKLASFSDTYWSFENPKHDFPKIIKYQRLSETNMQCTIGDGKKEVKFIFERQLLK